MPRSTACFALAALLLGAAPESLPLTLALTGTSADSVTITCTGKEWVDLPAGKLQRNAIIALPDAKTIMSTAMARRGLQPMNDRLIACDDGAGRDATVTGDLSKLRTVVPGQVVVQGSLAIVVLRAPSKPGQISNVVFAANSILGEDVFNSRSGKGLIRVDHKDGIIVYPPAFVLETVVNSRLFQLQETSPTSTPRPCVITYEAVDQTTPARTITSRLDCATLIQQVDGDAILSGKLPDSP